MLRKIGRDVAIYGSSDLALRLVGFFVFPIYAHLFSVEQFGALALIATSVGVVSIFASPGLNMAITRYYWDPQVTHTMRPIAVSTGLVALFFWSSSLVILVIAGIFPAREMIASSYDAAWVMVLFALLTVVPEQILAYCLNVLRLNSSPWKFAVVSFFKNIFGISLGLALVLGFDGGLLDLFIGTFVGAIGGMLIALLLIRKDLTIKLNFAMAKRLLTFGHPFIFAGLAYWIFGSVDRWMLAALSDAAQVGLYSIAYKFAGIVLFINAAFGQAWSPAALKLKSEDVNYRVAYSRVFSGWFFVLAIAGSAIVLFDNETLRLLTPSEYWAAAPAMAPLVMGVVLSGTTQITGIGISLENRTRLLAVAAWITALANVLLNLVLIPQLGALGAGIATFMSYVLLTFLYLFWSQKLHPIPLEKAKLFYSTAVVFGALVVGIWSIAGQTWSISSIVLKLVVLALIALGGFYFHIFDLAAVKEIGRWKRAVN